MNPSDPAPQADLLKINEIFYSIQGESLFAGKPTVFVRTTGCQMRCTWCDTAYAFYEGKPMSIAQVLEAARRYPTRYVCVTGGEPLLQKNAIPLMEALLKEGYTVSLETGGGVSVKGVPSAVIKVIDVKCPGSGETVNMAWENLELLSSSDQLKFVIAHRADFDWAIDLIEQKKLAKKCSLLFSPVFGALPPTDLAQWTLAAGVPATLQVQLHKILWGAERRGV